MEKYYFHAEVEKYSRKLRRVLIVVIVPIIAVCVFCSVNIVLNYSSSFVRFLIPVIAFSVLVGMIFTFAAVYTADRLRRRHSRYTYLDIIPDGLIYSEYAGEYAVYGDRKILRRLYYIPFSALESVERDAKQSPRSIRFKGGIREYYMESDRLGYHITPDGQLEFDTVILNTNYFTTRGELLIEESLGNTKRLEKSVMYYWEEFRKIPVKAPFDITKVIGVKKRKKLTTSNPRLEAPSFSRKWT